MVAHVHTGLAGAGAMAFGSIVVQATQELPDACIAAYVLAGHAVQVAAPLSDQLRSVGLCVKVALEGPA